MLSRRSVTVSRRVSRALSSVAPVQSTVALKRKFRERLDEDLKNADVGGGEFWMERQRAKGKLLARDRLDILLDKGSFREVDKLKMHRCVNFGLDEEEYPGDGVVAGRGLIDVRLSCGVAVCFMSKSLQQFRIVLPRSDMWIPGV
eukprot:scaffold848_cov247-Pinguiococcus_pyrenoidosus.AAC.26